MLKALQQLKPLDILIHFISNTTLKVKIAFSPIPGANLTGIFADKPIIKVAIKAPIAVEIKIPPNAIFWLGSLGWLISGAEDNILGCTDKIYNIAKNVVRPPIISFLKVVFKSPNLKKFQSFF
ncbi:MAG: hypothetical protein SPLM_07480 [Spiroplasma phoeniceum]